MIKDMSTATVIVILVLGAVLYGRLLASYIRNDGYGRQGGYRHPPRSHPADAFEAGSFLL